MEWVYFSNSESLQGSNASNQVLAQSDLLFQDGPLGGYLGYRNGTIIAILNLCVTVMPPIKFQLKSDLQQEMSFEEFQGGRHGGHLGYRNRTILAILNLCVILMPPIKFWLNLTYGSGGDVV